MASWIPTDEQLQHPGDSWGRGFVVTRTISPATEASLRHRFAAWLREVPVDERLRLRRAVAPLLADPDLGDGALPLLGELLSEGAPHRRVEAACMMLAERAALARATIDWASIRWPDWGRTTAPRSADSTAQDRTLPTGVSWRAIVERMNMLRRLEVLLSALHAADAPARVVQAVVDAIARESGTASRPRHDRASRFAGQPHEHRVILTRDCPRHAPPVARPLAASDDLVLAQ